MDNSEPNLSEHFKNMNEAELASLFFNLYSDCVKYSIQKEGNKKKMINCDKYLNNFEFFSHKFYENKETKD